MPKVGQKPIRRAALVSATIGEIGRTGSLDVTVGQIAKTAGKINSFEIFRFCLCLFHQQADRRKNSCFGPDEVVNIGLGYNYFLMTISGRDQLKLQALITLAYF